MMSWPSISALTAGTSRSAWMHAFTKKPMKPSFTWWRFSNRSLYSPRSFMIALMSTSLNVVSMAAVFCASFSRRAMVWRRRDRRTRSSRAASLATDGARIWVAGTGGVAIGDWVGASGAECADGGPASFATGLAAGLAAAITSSFRTCPRRPVPRTSSASSPFSSISLRAAGAGGGVPPLPAAD
jgi:hypothetical protein